MLDTLYVISRVAIDGTFKTLAVTHSTYLAERLSGKPRTVVDNFSCKMPRYRNGKVKETFKVWVSFDGTGKPTDVSFEQVEGGNVRVFDSMKRKNHKDAHYDRWYILLDDQNTEGCETMIEAGDYFRKESTDRLIKNPISGNLVFITKRRRYSNSLPYRLEISISRNIGTGSTRNDIAHEIDGMFTGSDGWKRLGELEYNVDYTLTPRSWEITPDLLTKDDEIKY